MTITEGEDKIFMRKIEVKLEGSDKLFNKRKRLNNVTKISYSSSTTTKNISTNKINILCKDNSKRKSQRIGKKINSCVNLCLDNEVEILNYIKKNN